jgi:transcriptional regulator with XRE-family HTH domain
MGELLAAWRKERGLTLKEMSGRVDIPLPTLNRIERGRLPDGKTMLKIFAWLFAPAAGAKNLPGGKSKIV